MLYTKPLCWNLKEFSLTVTVIIFTSHILDVCRKLNFILFWMRSIKTFPWHTNNDKYLIHISLSLSYLWSWISWPCWKLSFEPNLSSTKVCSSCHISNPSTQSCFIKFFRIKIMPVDLIFEFWFLIIFHRSRLDGEIEVKLPLQSKITRSRAEFVPQRANNK